MNRKNKNIIMSIVLVLLLVASAVTIKFASDSKSNKINDNRPNMSENGGPGGGGRPGNNSSSDSNGKGQRPSMNNNDSSSSNQPPEKPSDDSSSNSMGEPPSMNNDDSSSSNQPPEKPSDDSNSNSSTTASNTTDSSNNQNNGQRPDFNGTNGKSGNRNSKNSSISTTYYVLFGVEGLAIGCVLAYLILSNFNKKDCKETLKGSDKKIIYLLSVIIIAALSLGCDTLITKNLNSTNKNNTEQKMKNDDSSSQSSNATGSETVTEKKTLSDKYETTTSDESAILVKDGGEATITGATITKSGDSSNTENSEFYGINAGILVTSKSTATIKDATITTDAKGANAVFSTGTDSKIYISNSTITTTGSSSARGLDATYGGYIEADNVTITTKGGSCATLATDRGEGTVIAKNSKLETNGSGSPVIYSTGDISIENTTGTANGSQMVVIEGKNSATVTDSKLDASGKGNRGTTDQAGIMIYQSMSGDASEGTGTFTAKNSTLTIQEKSDYYKTAPMFFITNTKAVINLENTKLSYGSNLLISTKGTSEWGNSGSNGGDVTLNATKQELVGNIEIDKISTLVMNLSNSTYKGTINKDNTAKSITLKLDKDSKITLTGDSYITSLDNADSTNSNIDFNGYKLYVNGKAIN